MCIRSRNRVVAFMFLLTICAMIILPLGGSIAYAQGVTIPTVKSNIYVYDDEDLLSDEKESELNSLLINLERQTTIEFAVVTTDSFNGYSIEEYANTLANTLGVGKKAKDNGILLLISAKEGHGRLEIGYGLESVLTDSRCGRILDKYYVPHRQNSEHADSVDDTVIGVLSVLGEKYNILLTDNQEEVIKSINEEESSNTLAYIFLIAVFVIVLIFILIWYFGDDSSSSGSYSSSSSSSGGFSSGGGFGGGSFGGGGASR